MCIFQVLLGSELIKSSSEERSLLKNLGSWLGKITIGRNQVLRAREIDPKSLIIEVLLLIQSSWTGFTLFFPPIFLTHLSRGVLLSSYLSFILYAFLLRHMKED